MWDPGIKLRSLGFRGTPQSTEASDWASCIPGWPQIPHLVEEDFELLILLLPFLKDWDCKAYDSMFGLGDAGDQTPGLMQC